MSLFSVPHHLHIISVNVPVFEVSSSFFTNEWKLPVADNVQIIITTEH